MEIRRETPGLAKGVNVTQTGIEWNAKLLESISFYSGFSMI